MWVKVRQAGGVHHAPVRETATMHRLAGIRAMWGKISDRFAASRRASGFTCGECERNQRCGLPPHDDCPVRLAQIARDGAHSRRPMIAYYKALWPR
jgi:hypothetical protein